MYDDCIGVDIFQHNEFTMNEKRKKEKRKICFSLYAVSDLPLLCLSSSRQVDREDDDDGEEKRTEQGQAVYMCVFKKQLEIIPFLFSSQNDRKSA